MPDFHCCFLSDPHAAASRRVVVYGSCLPKRVLCRFHEDRWGMTARMNLESSSPLWWPSTLVNWALPTSRSHPLDFCIWFARYVSPSAVCGVPLGMKRQHVNLDIVLRHTNSTCYVYNEERCLMTWQSLQVTEDLREEFARLLRALHQQLLH